MKLLHVIGSIDPLTGGPGQGIKNLSVELKKLGIHEEVLSLDAPGVLEFEDNTLIHHAIGPSRGKWQYTEKLLPWLVENLPRFDVIILNGLWIYISFALWKAITYLKSQSSSNIPKLFIMPHGMLDPWFQQSSNRRVKAIRNSIYWFLIEHRVIKEADGLLFTSHTERLLARKPFYPYSPKREDTIGYGIQEPPPYTLAMKSAFRDKCPAISNHKYILFLSRIHEKKGVDLLIKAYAGLLQKQHLISSPIPKLVIAGPGLTSTYGKMIQQLVNDVHYLNDWVIFSDMIAGEVKWSALYGCEAFILPSYQENFGIAVVEALACKKSVLISNQINIFREIEEGSAGIIFENSIEEIQRALEKWINMANQEQHQMQLQAYKIHQTHFSIAHVAQRLLKTISD